VQFPLVAVMLHLQGQPILSPWLWIFPAVLVFHFLFNLALALILSSTNVYYRDIQHLVGVGLSAWFFVSPVMYNLVFVQEHTQAIPGLVDLFMLNPISVIVTGYRLALMPGVEFPGAACAAASVGATFLFLGLSYRVFQRLEKNFADML
jgi:ABC-type polysaccharide/polyol phosphate export permease